MNLKEKIYRIYSELRLFKNHWRDAGFSIGNGIEYIKLNYFTSAIIRSRCSFLANLKYSIIELGKDSQIIAKANMNIGVKQVKNSKLETRLLLEKNARLYINGDFDIYAGSYIRIMENGTLILHGGFINENVQITCGGVVEIGKGCAIARDVIIRSNDGHEIIKEGHCSSRAIHIGEHVWIGQGAMILKGVTIGEGAIIGAGSVVTKNIPKYAVAVGNPARVIHRNIEWH
jgi:acetyltransferase-like isoleucine patch superfamily enzyme